MQEDKDSDMKQVCGSDTQCAREYTTKKQDKIRRALPSSQLFSAMPSLEAVKVLVSIMMSSPFPRNNPETHSHQTSREGSSEVWQKHSWQIDPEHVRNSGRFPQLTNRLCSGESGGLPKSTAALFHNPNQDVRMAELELVKLDSTWTSSLI